MPTAKQITVNAPTTDGGLGRSNSARVAVAFAASPIHSGDDPLIDDGTLEAPIRKHYQELCLDGVINDGGHTFGEFNPNFADNGAPSPGDVPTGGGGLPASAYVPNITSPGPGSMNPTDMPAPPDGFGQEAPTQWGTGVGSQLSPAQSSEKISSQKLGQYLLGKAVIE